MIYNQQLDKNNINIKKRLKYSDNCTLIPIKYNNNDLIIQTPKMYIPYGEKYVYNNNNKKFVDEYLLHCPKPDILILVNENPEICLEPIEVVEKAVSEILTLNNNNFGHIFNLGHGVLPETDPEVLSRVVEMVHSHKLPERKDG